MSWPNQDDAANDMLRALISAEAWADSPGSLCLPCEEMESEPQRLQCVQKLHNAGHLFNYFLKRRQNYTQLILRYLLVFKMFCNTFFCLNKD